jgi:ankyrin repeat protein
MEEREMIEMKLTSHRQKNDKIEDSLATLLMRKGNVDIEWLRSAMTNFEDVNCRDVDGKTLLQVVLQIPWIGQEAQRLEGINLLISKGAEVNLKDRRGQTAIHVAVEQNVPKQILSVLAERAADINAINNDNKTPLHLLLERSQSALDYEKLKILLKAGADPFYSRFEGDVCDVGYCCPLYLLLDNSDSLLQNLRYFRQLCPEDDTRIVRTLLLHAASTTKASDLELLLEGVVSLEAFCDTGQLLLLAAQSSQDADHKVDLLLHYDVNLVHSTTKSGMGLYHVASLQGSLQMLKKATINFKTSVDGNDNCGNTPLHYVASSRHSDLEVVDCANYLVSLGANVDVLNDCGLTPLDTALKFQKKRVVMVLVHAGARLPHSAASCTLNFDQLSILAECDVIASSKKPVIYALQTAGFMQKMKVRSYNDQRQYKELAETLEETASIMLTFDLERVSDVTDEVVFAAVTNFQKQFVSGRAVQEYVNRKWYKGNSRSMRSIPRGLFTVLLWAMIFYLLPLVILFYVLPRYGRGYHVFLHTVRKRISPAVRYFVAYINHVCFIVLLVYDSVETEGLRVQGVVDRSDYLVFFFILTFCFHEMGQLLMKGRKLYFRSWQNRLDLIIFILFFVFFVTRAIDLYWVNVEFREAAPYLAIGSLSYALASFLFILRSIQHLCVFPKVGMVVISTKQIVRNILSFLLVWGLLLLAFTIVMSRVYPTSVYRYYQFVEECVQRHYNKTMQNSTDIEVVVACVHKVHDLLVPRSVQGFATTAGTLIWSFFGLRSTDDFEAGGKRSNHTLVK